ncbi:hypothetical protein ACP70R_020677 [Stipagrostis hirtigluma subsp. patula]
MKKTIVLYPGLLASHFVPMMHLADVLLEEGYAVAVALIDITMEEDAALAAAVDRAASTKPSVAFHTLPRIHDPPTMAPGAEFLAGYYELMRRYNRRLRDLVSSMGRVHAVIVDIGSMEAFDVTRELGVPAYGFVPTNASALAVFIQLPWIRREDQPSFLEQGDAHLNFHGVPPMPASNLMGEFLQDPMSEIYKAMMRSCRRNLEADGLLVNTLASLEDRAVRALTDPQFLPGSSSACTVPPVYCVGPLIAAAGGDEPSREKHECIAWLDEQPERSVVFLCFGVLCYATHAVEQLREIAVGLERSGHRFLWVVRDPTGDPDLDELLPEGFLERTKGRGLVVKQWAPQVEVLLHGATGAFVTHSGWNSVLEGITAGVPMLCWPMYAEQKMNKVVVVEELGVGVEVAGWQQGLVKAEEVEAKVRLVMETREGERIRARVTEHREAAAMAWKEGGSSRAALRRFLSDVSNLSVGPARP